MFEIHERLMRNDARWDDDVLRLGDPLILIGHEGWTEAEATVLAHPRWRCVYFDEIASVFVPRRGPSSSPGIPDVNFAASHENGPASAPSPEERDRAAIEVQAILRLSPALRRRGGDPWRSRIPMLIGASDRVRGQLSGESSDPTPWRLLGLIAWELVPDLTRPPPGPTDSWDPATGLPWARATYCFRRALEAAPGDIATTRALAASFGVRRMSEARRQAESVLAGRIRPEDLFRHQEESFARPVDSSWASADRIAAAYLHLGNPGAARDVWAAATDAPSPGLRWARMAGANLVARDLATAEQNGRRALKLDRELGEAWYVLSLAIFEAGRADDTLAACREGLKHRLTPAQREHLAGIIGLTTRRR